MTKKLVFGHKNPDTDTICSAIVYAELKNKIGEEAEAVRLGEVSSETQYALDYFRVDAPRLVETVANEVDKVILVDHNERQQSAADIDEVEVAEVIDHHRIANFETKGPLYYRAEPVGCTATILTKMFKENGEEISKSQAGLLLSSIISDSLLFKSPTCTDEDVKAAKELETIAGVDAESYGLELLKAGADISGLSAEELLSLDAKEFSMGNSKVEIAQVNTVDTEEVLQRKSEISKAIKNTISDKSLGLFVFVITDILTNDSTVIALGDEASSVNQAFGVELKDNQAVLEGVVSRKKQIVPPLNEQFV
ncbi:manganese-dependent inorganic pyrophosphatase [Halobacillus sp. A1]|uniref:manganese-dependent inorganic pyrophosphatase n=1 Tax=Halobacillus sp. A1 TaxID=2880262 RepID=UPI0020A6B404|nr:manganese-dependent inorganic pyrophosphatase [Halobacillus sp. A1]MCP3030606.1 manganese-dependent inorganic pyrophosphatase [Halobacillus sp. A1]